MRKFACVSLSLLVIASILLYGCGKNKEEGYLQKIESTIKKIDSGVNEFSDDLDKLTSNLESSTELTASLLEEAYETFKRTGDEIVRQYRQALNEIQNILKDKEVPDYKKYIQLHENILKNASLFTEIMAKLTSELSAAASALQSDHPPEAKELAEKTGKWAEELKRLIESGKELNEDIKKFKE